MKLPTHMSLSIEHNQHKNSYSKIEEYLLEEPMERIKELSDEEFKICVSTNELWEIQWYPITPIGFHYVCGPTLESCLEKIQNGEWD